MRCSNCGKENSEKDTVCANCGTELADKSRILDQTMSFFVPGEVEEERAIDLDKLVAEGPVLVVVKGRSVGETFTLTKDEVWIGRDPASDIFLDDITVSRGHAKIEISDEETKITDIDSLNGTYVNHKQIEESKLEDRDEIQIGKFKLVFLAKK